MEQYLRFIPPQEANLSDSLIEGARVMEDKITVGLATADKTRKAQVTLPGTMTVGELVSLCKQRWNLPASEDFAVRDAKRNVQLDAKQSLATAGVTTGAELEVFPLLEAGYLCLQFDSADCNRTF
jgi:hypothetical protein